MSDLHHAAERLALVLTENGMQRMTARVFAALLFAEGDTMTAGDLGQQLNVSAGAVSGAVKTLLTVGMIERVPAPGSRRDHYRFRDDAWSTVMTAKNHVIKVMEETASEGIEAAGPDSAAGRRLAEMRDFYRYVLGQTELILDRWSAARAEGEYPTPAP
ncbi:GbsR/MarR family transcriptional regulator [Longispora albida]|uniref:GbsR/MarR family transcriptional regulator n=1 Tax=Longispora albida TaxID=203523 RepID=UPI00036AABC8|nr:MarR family transcriptional regulator [Longispora albida]